MIGYIDENLIRTARNKNEKDCSLDLVVIFRRLQESKALR